MAAVCLTATILQLMLSATFSSPTQFLYSARKFTLRVSWIIDEREREWVRKKEWKKEAK